MKSDGMLIISEKSRVQIQIVRPFTAVCDLTKKEE